MNNRISRTTAFVLALALGPVVANATTPTSGTPIEGPNGNFYEFVAAGSFTWDAANTAAINLTFNGIVGHLATITSEEEDDFIEEQRQLTSLVEVWVGGFQTLPCSSGSEPTCGWTWVNDEGIFPGDNLGPEYANWGGPEPNDNTGVGSENHLAVGLGDGQAWNDEGAIGNITGYVVEYDFSTVFVPPSEDPVTFLDGANDPFSPHGVSAGYQEVLEGGNWSISCCTVVDWREGMGTGGKFGDYLPVDLDLGLAINLAAVSTDLNCLDLQVLNGGVFGPDKAKVHPWQRAVPDPMAASRTGAEFGVCFVQSGVIARGVLFTEEEPENVLGYPVDCSEPQIDDRPYTSGVAIVPTDVDSPYAIRESADCDGSRSGKRSSDRLIVLNEWHYKKHKKTQPYLSMFAASLLQVIDDERTRIPACVDNTGGYLDDLTSLVQEAKNEMKKKGDPGIAEDALNNATRLALLIPTMPASGPVVPSDPYSSTTPFCLANNAQGLIAGRLMALKFANCSENLHPNDSSSSSESLGTTGLEPRCEIATDIFDVMPTLP